MVPLVLAGISLGIVAGVLLSYRGHDTVWSVAWMALFPVQLETVQLLGFRLAPGDALLAGVVGGLLLRWGRERQTRLPVNTTVVLCGAIFVWLIVAAAQGVTTLGYLSAYVVVNKLIGFLVMVCVYWVTLWHTSSCDAATRLATWFGVIGGLWSLVGCAGFALWRLGGVENPLVYGEGRLCGLLVDPNAFGGYLCAVLVVWLALYLKGVHRGMLPVFNIAVVFYALLLTSSRSAWLALIVGLAGLVLFLEPHERMKLAPVAILLVFEAVVHFTVLSPESLTLASRVPQVEARLSIARKALDAFRSSPLLGIGLGVFHTLPESGGLIIHSTYLWFLVETGLPGVILLISLIATFGWQFFKASRSKQATSNGMAVACCVGVLAWLGLMVGVEAFYQRHFWFLAGLLGTMAELARPLRAELVSREGGGHGV